MNSLKNVSFRVAAASRDGIRVDTHFGFATVYHIINVDIEDKTPQIHRIHENSIGKKL